MRRLLWTAALLCGACNSAMLSSTKADVSVAPPLLDLGTILLGQETSGRVTLKVDRGVASVLDVNIVPFLGEGFAYDGPAPFVIDADDDDGFDMVFRPALAGYAGALVQVTTDGRDPVVELEIRARAVAAQLRATPVVVDLGMVPAGSVGEGAVRIDELGGRPVVLDGFTSSALGLGLLDSFPIAILANGYAGLTVSYAAATNAPMVGRLSFQLGTATVSDLVIVRANNCEEGLPGAYDRDQDGFTTCGGDCDDGDPEIRPGQVELLNGVDDDCDRLIDEGTSAYDDDGDGYCEGPVCVGGKRPGDCHDGDASVSPAAHERANNGVDDDCDGVVDLGGPDADHDGFGPTGGDCDDNDASRHPGAIEQPNGLDDDCDGLIDEGTLRTDDDGDGYCEGPVCSDGSLPGDCLDSDVGSFPDAPEQPDFIDNDCDGAVDEGTVRGDDDGDGFTEIGGDCDDNDPLVNPALGGCP